MKEKKKIPCRTCGKLFEPCAYCQSHSDIFQWRNFACSKECATKYINDTIAHREALKQSKNNDINITTVKIASNSNDTTKRKYNKRNPTNNVGKINEESEQID